ncbi:hypothetical protein EGK_18574 [Macaca mulatta]|uniref:Tumor necrosis factor alpha-induced protein 2 n=1 Tax=Macaca mulatta TaxID=9544 RepID=G7MWG7_MACMU|nr:hypothetical protein EGK_18574 [Macaca mulatta]
MSVASSEDLVPPLEAGTALYREEEKTVKKKKEKKKKSKGLANVFCVFTKGKKKKGQLSSAEPEGTARSRQGLDGPPPTGALGPWARASLGPGRGWRSSAGPANGVGRRICFSAFTCAPICGAGRGETRLSAQSGTPTSPFRVGQRPNAGPEVPENVFLHLGRTMKEDLEAVVERLKPLFPAEFGVVAAYAESYHQHFAAHLAAVAQFELCERDTYMLLVWVQNLYPNDIINSPKLAGELQGVGLGSLLPPRQIRLLEATFLSNEAANVRELMDRALDLEAQHWAEDVPPQRLDGHCHSELAIDIIQIISQAQAKAESITLDLGSQIKQVLLVELPAFLRSYQRAFSEFLERGKQLRNYRANVIANINNCLSFRMSMEQKWQVPQDTLSLLLGPLGELKSHGFDTLLQNLREDLKPLFKRFTHTRWAAPMETLEKIITTVDVRLPEFSELQDCFREELMEAVHLHLVKEYIIQLSKRRLVLKTAEQQQQLAGHILANADTIQHFCTQHGSPATWLQPALPTLAEIIRLQDPSAIKIEVATYATCYPDFSKGHLSAILAIKGNLSNSEAKSIRSILDVSTGAQEPSRSLFSLIKVG